LKIPISRRLFLRLLTAALALLLALCSWVWWGDWPDGVSSDVVSDPAIVVVLGGGDGARVREALRLAERFPDVPILVTGDSGFISAGLRAAGIADSRIRIEPAATSTWENAVFSKTWIDEAGSGQLVLVTNDFHAPRSRAVFRKIYPGRDIVLSCETTAKPYNKWQQAFRQRERAAALYYLVRYGVWSW
jgi:uncharacterized SAM-binding protein YcdF (DUF218 family)